MDYNSLLFYSSSKTSIEIVEEVVGVGVKDGVEVKDEVEVVD